MFSRLLLMLLCCGLLLGDWRNAAHAQESLPLRVAIIDVQRVRTTAAAVKSIRAQLETHMQRYRSETQGEEQSLRAQREELARRRAILSQEAFQAERQALEKKLGEAQGRLQQRQQSINRVRGEAMKTVLSTLQEVVTGIARERQLTLILRRESTVFANTGFDITDEVLRRLDARLPTVPLANPG